MEDLRIGVLGLGLRASLAKAAHRPGMGSVVAAICDTILRAARDTGTRLYVGHNMRHKGVIGEPKTVWVRHFVSYGGDYCFKDWHAERERTTGLLLQKAAHDLDVVHWPAGGYTERVNAFGDLMVYGDLPRRAPDTPRPEGWLREFDIAHKVPEALGTHGGADHHIIAEFCRFVREGGQTDTSPVAARMSVAAGYMATLSLRNGGTPYEVPSLDPELVAYFDGGQTRI
ncbi:Gfo/Idh/MocA family oxidoreductase [Streptosporangium roseum]|uniref:GFO/IDH/MocA-like oxidoreductase domain-containing protein n=1 Tax=Streptosporangium roseum (strain ATCC 12428 / DSM 43021 / JCM 3005 / KCTC 9067 / NCIMB 10171 / NRRL 2505 / NI 9100) TaxID=479432 RepID=D2BE92_STRRD|nr:Gfo/Idh/MocA family oxidoreductase [Streptosporangium roseum]ACZ90138.1 hypothetical protein Sros_7455 [Streptosporangium roseum DSM 43021]